MTTKVIVVGVDGTPAGAAAMQWATREARLHGAQLKLVHAWHPDPTLTMSGMSLPWLALESEARSLAMLWVREAIGADDEFGNPRKVDIVQDVAGPALVAASEGAEMLVVGTHVHTGLGRVLQGSVSHYCLTHATCVVTAVPIEVVREENPATTELKGVQS